MRRLAVIALIGALALMMSAGVSSPVVAGGKHYGYGYQGGYGYHGHGYYGAAVAVGLAGLFVGLLLHDATYHAPPTRTVYVPAPVRRVYVPAPVRYAGRPAQAWTLPPNCLMIREYQTRLTVGGRQVEGTLSHFSPIM